MNTKTENTAVSETVRSNAEIRAAANEKSRKARAAEGKKQLTANQKRDRFGSLDGVGVVPVTGENGVTNGYAVGMLVSELKANGKSRRAMVTLQEALEGASIYAADFNKWTKRIFKERFVALVEADKFAKYAGMSLLAKEAEGLPEANKAYQKWKAEREAERKNALDAWGRLSETLAKQSNGTEKAKWLFSELLKNLPEGAEIADELKAFRTKVIDTWLNK
jgi:hypothetical protein